MKKNVPREESKKATMNAVASAKPKMIVAIVLVSVLATFAAWAAILRPAAEARLLDADIAAVKECQTQKSPVICSRESIRHMITLASASDVMDALAGNISLVQCHFEGHVVGQQLYAKTQSVEEALQQCNRQCDSACVHGVIGEAFAEELGFGDALATTSIDFEHLNLTQLDSIGRRLCATAETCHGVGHTVFHVAKKLTPSMALCDKIASQNTVVPCYNGVTMEYADILTSRNMRSAPEVTLPTVSSLKGLCMLDSAVQRRACFRYFERYVIATLTAKGYSRDDALAETRKICESFSPGEDRISCMTSMGSYYNFYVITDPAAAKAVCDKFTNLQDKASCILGEVFVAVADRKEGIAKYCASFPDERIRRVCYQSLFSHLRFVGENMNNVRGLCEAGNVACIAGFEDYKLDSWDVIGDL